MNYQNGREARIGDAIVSLTNHRTGVVSRTDGEKLQFLTFAERKAGEPYSLVPVMVGPRGQERHWEPVGLEVPSGTCLHVEDVISEEQHRREIAVLQADRATLEKQLAAAGGSVAPADPNQLTLPEGEPAEAGTPNSEGKPAEAGTPNSD